MIDELAGEYAGRLKVGKVNVDEENALAGLGTQGCQSPFLFVARV
jgi:thioredoxin-like negative regulator of GroEL